MKGIIFSLLCASGILLGVIPRTNAAVSPSEWVYPSGSGNLLSAADTNGVRINDFSDCGYKRGEAALPEIRNFVPENTWIRLTPLEDGRDNSDMINAALYFAGTRPTNAHGFRGVVFLEAGEYRVDSTIWMTNSGVVLKGAGSSLTSGTRLRATLRQTQDVISVSYSFEPSEVPNTSTSFAEPLVPAGTRTFRVNYAGAYTVGDLVLIRHLAHPNWIHDLDMDQLNGTWYAPYASTGDFERQITRIEGDWITVGAPVPQTFEARYGGGTIRRLAPGLRVENSGVEDLACTFGTDPGEDDALHPTAAVRIADAKDIWMRNVVASGYFSSCVVVQGYTRFVTVAECQMFHPANSNHHNRYAFLLLSHAANVLMRDCFSQNSRHDYILSSAVPGPNAFVRCRTSNSDDDTGPHQRWATGGLFDNISVDDSGNGDSTSGELNVQNRGNSGEGESYHGWVGAYMAVWNCYAENGFRVRNPPTALNWLIGSEGELKESKRGCWYQHIPFAPDGDCWAVGADPAGTYDQSGEDASRVQMRSLYYAQLQQKLKWPGSQFREYRLGDIDQLAASSEADANAPISALWLGQLTAAAGGAPVHHQFDEPAGDSLKAFTVEFPLAPGERVVAASLTLGLRFNGGFIIPSIFERLHLDSATVSSSFGSLGWSPTRTGSSAHTVEVDPALLQDGRLNVAVTRHCGVDYATLHLQVSSAVTFDSTRGAVADTYVRDGSFGNQNFGGETELVVKTDSDGGFNRKSLLKWDLTGLSGEIADAKVRLYCNATGQAGNEQMAYLVTDDTWTENGMTWNLFKTWPVDKPVAYWVPVPGQFVEFTVTPEAAAALAGDRLFSVALEAVQNWGDAGWVTYASREDPDASHRPQLLVKLLNHAPTIVVPPNQGMTEDSTLGPLPITIGDAETPAANLAFTVTSSNPFAIANTNITVGGSDADRTVTLRTLPGQRGFATISVQVSDGAQTSTASFLVYVRFTNSPPRIEPISDQTMPQATSLDVLFTVSDRGNFGLGTLQVTARASDRNLFPAGSLQIIAPRGIISIANGTHVLRLIPAPERSGSALITLSASDGEFTTSETFTVTVTSAGDLPDGFAIISPHDGDVLRAGAPVRITAYVPSEPWFGHPPPPPPVAFYFRGRPIATLTAPPYSIVWSNPPPGTATFQAYATNSSGRVATSAPVTVTFTTNALPGPRLLPVLDRGRLVLVWLVTMDSFTLESATDLGPSAIWSRAEATPRENDGLWYIPLSPVDDRRFFRLRLEGR